MSVEEIPSDELITMTKQFHEAFKVLGCDPACHCCWKLIEPNDKFKLSTVDIVHTHNPAQLIDHYIKDYERLKETKEVMLCDICTPERFDKVQKKRLKNLKMQMDNHPLRHTLGCFRINGKIIH